MYSINDPMFALILRFVGYQEQVGFCNDEFIQKQLRTIHAHIARFPKEEQELRAVEWIEKYARRYRKAWEEEILAREFSGQRCPDCPLLAQKGVKHCRIHQEWLDLLQHYASGEINSKEYVNQGLKLLADHKTHLKYKMSDFRWDQSVGESEN